MGIKKIRLGNRIVEVTQRKSQKHPVIHAEGKQIERENGRIDCVVNVPCIEVVSEQHKPE